MENPLMNSVWQQVTLATLPLQQWRQVSYVYRIVGSLQNWRNASWLMQHGDAIAAIFISIVFALSPFVATNLIGVLLSACILLWILLTVSDTDKRAGLTPIHVLVMLFWSISATAAALSPLKKAAFTGFGKLSLYLMFFILAARVFRSPKLRSFCITIFLHVALVVSGYGIQQAIYGADSLATWVDPESPLAQSTRVYSFLGNPNLLAGYLMPAIWLSFSAIFMWKHRVPKILAIVMFGINTACLLLTQSRGSWVGLMVSALVMLVLLRYWWSPSLPQFWRKWGLILAFGGLVGALVLGYLFVTPFRYRIVSMFAGSKDSSNAFRLNVWRAVLMMIHDRPILGFGPGDLVFKQIYPLYSQARFSGLSAYSVLLEVTVESGFIGLTAFLWLLTTIFSQGYFQLRRIRDLGDREGFWLMGAIATMVGMLVHGSVDTVLYRPEVSVLWWMSIALIASFYVPQAVTSQSSDWVEEQ
jgi:putative inorganic carbon (HCO3(-)) transporter